MIELIAWFVIEKYKRIGIPEIDLPRTEGLARYYFNLAKASSHSPVMWVDFRIVHLGDTLVLELIF